MSEQDPRTTDDGSPVLSVSHDAEDPVVITPCPDGPLLVRGDVLIAPEPGAEPQKPPRRVVALCRCNMSSIAPFCDGSHKLANFRTRPPRYNIGNPREDPGEED